jgi:tetratricopeptide (TPR) repeat protein
VRKAENRLRITVQLTDSESGYQLWAARYDRELSDIFSIQEEIAQNIVATLEVTLPAEETGALRNPPTRNVQAYDYYLRGRKFYYYYSRRDIEFAIQLFNHAIALDPAFVLAHAGLADCWAFVYLNAERSDHARQEADTASLRAVELDPASAQAQASRGLALSLSARNSDAERAFTTAIRLDPGLFEARYFYARHTFSCGELEKAVGLYEEAMRIRPEDYVALIGGPELRSPNAQRTQGPPRAGIRCAEEQLNQPTTRAITWQRMAWRLGRKRARFEWAQRALVLAPDEGMVLYNVGCIYALLGKFDDAIEILEKAVKHGLTHRGWYENDSNLDPLRSMPRFQELLGGLA